MLPSKMDRRINLLRNTRSLDEFGQQVENWAVIAQVWAAVKPISDGEKFGSGQVKAFITHRFQIRYSSQVSNIDGTWRIEFDGLLFDISGVKEMGRKEGFELTATSRAERG